MEVARFILVALAASAISLAVTKSELFSEFRALFEGRGKLEALTSCPFCFGFWTCAALFALVLPDPAGLRPADGAAWPMIRWAIVSIFSLWGTCALLTSQTILGYRKAAQED